MSCTNKQTNDMKALKLKFKKHTDYIGNYVAQSEYRGYDVRVEISKYPEGGFCFTTYINNHLTERYGYVGLRKSDILSTIDQNVMDEIDEMIRWKNL